VRLISSPDPAGRPGPTRLLEGLFGPRGGSTAAGPIQFRGTARALPTPGRRRVSLADGLRSSDSRGWSAGPCGGWVRRTKSARRPSFDPRSAVRRGHPFPQRAPLPPAGRSLAGDPHAGHRAVRRLREARAHLRPPRIVTELRGLNNLPDLLRSGHYADGVICMNDCVPGAKSPFPTKTCLAARTDCSNSRLFGGVASGGLREFAAGGRVRSRCGNRLAALALGGGTMLGVVLWCLAAVSLCIVCQKRILPRPDNPVGLWSDIGLLLAPASSIFFLVAALRHKAGRATQLRGCVLALWTLTVCVVAEWTVYGHHQRQDLVEETTQAIRSLHKLAAEVGSDSKAHRSSAGKRAGTYPAAREPTAGGRPWPKSALTFDLTQTTTISVCSVHSFWGWRWIGVDTSSFTTAPIPPTNPSRTVLKREATRASNGHAERLPRFNESCRNDSLVFGVAGAVYSPGRPGGNRHPG